MTLQGLEKRIEKLERMLGERTAALAEFTSLARVKADGFDQTDTGAQTENGEENGRPVRRLASWGIAGLPPTKTMVGLVKATGSAFSGMIVGVAADNPKAPGDLKDGETCLYNSVDGTRVLLDKDGAITIQAKGATIKIDSSGKITVTAASGQNIDLSGAVVNLNGSTYGLPLWPLFLVPFKAFLTTLQAATTVANVVAAALTLSNALTAGTDFTSTKVKHA